MVGNLYGSTGTRAKPLTKMRAYNGWIAFEERTSDPPAVPWRTWIRVDKEQFRYYDASLNLGKVPLKTSTPSSPYLSALSSSGTTYYINLESKSSANHPVLAVDGAIGSGLAMTGSVGTPYSGSNPEVIEDWERSSPLGDYSGDTGALAVSTSNPSHESNHLRGDTDNRHTIVSTYNSGLPNYPDPQSDHDYLWKTDIYLEDVGASANHSTIFGVVDSSNFYQLLVSHSNESNPVLQLYKQVNGSFTKVNEWSVGVTPDQYVTLYISHHELSNGNIDVSFIFKDGGTTKGPYEYTFTSDTFAARGIGWKYNRTSSTTYDWDYARMEQAPADYADTASKSSSNPVISGTSADGDQSYSGSVIEDPSGGTYYAYLKSGDDIHAFSSSDLDSWTHEGTVLLTSSSGFDSNRLSSPIVRYDPNNSTYHMDYAGDDGSTLKVGHATSSSALSGWSKSSSNPIAAPGDVTTGTFDTLFPSEHVVSGGTHYVYCTASGTDPNQLVTYSGSDWTSLSFDSSLVDASNLSTDGNIVQDPAVYESGGTWNWVFAAGGDDNTFREREMFYGRGTGPTDFTALASVAVSISKPPSWGERRSYGGDFLKDQDGNYLTANTYNSNVQMLYWGHALNNQNNGYTGRAYWSTFPDVTTMETL